MGEISPKAIFALWTHKLSQTRIPKGFRLKAGFEGGKSSLDRATQDRGIELHNPERIVPAPRGSAVPCVTGLCPHFQRYAHANKV